MGNIGSKLVSMVQNQGTKNHQLRKSMAMDESGFKSALLLKGIKGNLAKDYEKFKKQIGDDKEKLNSDRSDLRKSIQIATLKFEKTSKGTSGGNPIVENQHLKTTLTILNQKLKSQKDADDMIYRLQLENKDLKEKNRVIK